MIDTSTAQPLLQRVLNFMETAARWEREAAKRAHIVGLQGEKRRLRYLYRCARDIVDWTEHKAYDVLKVDIKPQSGTADVTDLQCPMSTMNGIIDKLETIYNEAHQLANDLVSVKFRKFAKPLYKYSDKLFSIIGELHRAQIEYERANYEYHHISRYQVSYVNVHDKYAKKEKKQGYMEM